MDEKRIPARCYQTEIGREPVREWLKRLEMILLHGFIQKTEKTSAQDLNLALERKSKLEARK